MAAFLVDYDVVFLHIPRTAGHWLLEVFEANQIQAYLVNASNTVHRKLSPHRYFDDPKAEQAFFRCIFVRNPISWYESWWKFQAPESNESDAWDPTRFLPKREGITDFNKWIELCIEKEPAFVTRMFEWYIGPPGLREMDYVGRYEHLHEHLSTILGEVGLDISVQKLKVVPVANASKQSVKVIWDNDVKKRLIETEISCLHRFYSDEHDLQPY